MISRISPSWKRFYPIIPYNNYPPINIEIGQIFVIDYYKLSGNVERRYYIADGTVWKDMPSTRQFVISE